MSLVIDASVAVKWVVAEDGRQSALAVPDVAELIAPDFVLLESASVMWKKVRRGEMAPGQMKSGLDFIREAIFDLVPLAELLERASQLALTFDHPVYDCLYVACAEARHADLLTADSRLAEKFRDHVRVLGISQ